VISQAILWGTIGLVFAPLADRLLTRSATRTKVTAT
jgi:hypothetical protein